MSLPLSAGVGTIWYSLFVVTVLSELFILTGVVALPDRDVCHVMTPAGRPFPDSQLATETADVPAGTVMDLAMFIGLAKQQWVGERQNH